MTSFPFLIDLFQAVLDKSKAIEGRFSPIHQNGAELNSDEMGQVISKVIEDQPFQKYPLAMMFPPAGYGELEESEGGWMDWNITMFFLQASYMDSSSMTRDRNPVTGTSMHSVPMDWHDMARAAISFTRMVERVQILNYLHSNFFRMKQKEKKSIIPVSLVGKDMASGVRLDFKCSTFIGCEVEDYPEGAHNTITIPVSDSHPEHFL